MKENNKEFSTTALAKELNISTRELFQQLFDLGYISRQRENWELTHIGKKRGGKYREHDKYGKYIVWPDYIKESLDENESSNEQNLFTSTIIGKHFNMSAKKFNSILSELGWIEKSIKGYCVTNIGKMVGGIQYQHRTTGAFYVRWPDSIKNNNILLSSINEVKGDVPTPINNISKDEIEFRDKFKPTFRATDGHMVRSKSEVLIDNELYRFEIAHAYERKLPIEEDVYCDFYIPSQKVYIEYWGYEENSKYLKRKDEKLNIYKKYDFRLIELTDKEVQNLDDHLPRLLLNFGIRTE
jgi:hypothetical protein